MANSTVSPFQGACLPPFLDASLFPPTGGYVTGRFCAHISALPGNPLCCLPCPATAYAYTDDFPRWMTAIEWLNVVGLILLTFMLLSYVVLPVQATRSHYLSVCLIVAVMMMAIGFTIPLAAQPDQCYNQITPNDMYSLTECAWSGAFIVAGGLSTAMWIFIRALSMNLQICWDIVPGQKFFYYSQALGWGIPAVLFTATMTFTGVSFRFGRECDVNHHNSMKDFWGPLMGMVGAAGILQLMTFVHCLRVYLRNLFDDKADSSTTASTSGLPSYNGSSRMQSQKARVVWRRLKKVLWLQWRGIAIVTVMVVDVVFFSVVFVYLDALHDTVKDNFAKVEPWIECLVLHPTDKGACQSLVGGWLVNQPTVVAVLILISLAGFQIFLFVARPSIFPGWWTWIASKFSHRQEFVSLDARPEIMRSTSKQGLVERYQQERGSVFEMQTPGMDKPKALHLDIDSKSPTYTVLSSPDEAYRSPLVLNRGPNKDDNARLSGTSSFINKGVLPDQYLSRLDPVTGGLMSPPTPVVRYDSVSLYRQDSDYFSQQRPTTAGTQHSRAESSYSQYSERRYQPPTASFSAPQPPPSRHTSMKSVSFDPRDTFSRGGLALNPPSEAGESVEEMDIRQKEDLRVNHKIW